MDLLYPGIPYSSHQTVTTSTTDSCHKPEPSCSATKASSGRSVGPRGDAGARSRLGLVYKEGQQLRTCHVCIARHIDCANRQNNSLISNLHIYIRHDRGSLLNLQHALRRGYPECLLLDLLFYAVEVQAWNALDHLLAEPSANLWAQCYNENGHNILQNILSSKAKLWSDRGSNRELAGAACRLMHQLQGCMDRVSLKAYVNKMWRPKYGEPVCYPLHSDGLTVLHMATHLALTDCVLGLLSCGANPDIIDGKDKTPLMIAAQDDNIEILEVLVSHGAKVSISSEFEESALSCLVTGWPKKTKLEARRRQALRVLLQAAEYIHIFEYKILVHYLDEGLMCTLLEQGFPISYDNEEVKDGTLLSTADTKLWSYTLTCGLGDRECVQVLSDNLKLLDIDINQSISPPICLCDDIGNDCCGCTALQTACRAGKPDIVDCLLGYGADPDFSGSSGRFPILHVLEYRRRGAIECVISLLRYGCELNVACPISIQGSLCSSWLFPLDFFLVFNQLFIVKMLRIAGASKYCPEIHVSFKPDETVLFTSPTTLERENVPDSICKAEMRKDVLDELNSVPTLYHLSRLAIRHAMHRDISTKVQSLPLPKHIQEYLNLEELFEIEQEYLSIELPLIRDLHYDSDSDNDPDDSDTSSNATSSSSWSDEDSDNNIYI